MKGIDAQLIDRCRRSDERALYTLYHQSYSLMKGIAVRYVFDKAEVPDIINRAFVKVVKALDKYDDKQALAPWMSTIVIHESIDYVRRVMRAKDKQPLLIEDMTVCDKSNHDWNTADRDYDAQRLLKILDLLPPKTKVVFNLFAIDGYSHDEIGSQLGISSGTSKWHVSKARELLQAALLKLDNEQQAMS